MDIVVKTYDKHIVIQREKINSSTIILEQNKKTLNNFLDFCHVDSRLGEAIKYKYSHDLRRIAELVDKPFKEMIEQDMFNLIAKLNEMKTNKGAKFSENTLQDYRKTISKFWRWLYYDEFPNQTPPPIRRIKIKSPRSNKEPEIYTRDEIKTIINGVPTIRDKAFFSCMYDLQCRVSELLTRKLKHIRYSDSGDIEILIEAEKTKFSHWETIYEAAPMLSTWLRCHPTPDDPEAPLWVVIRKKKSTDPLIKYVTYDLVRKVFKNTCKKYNIRNGQKCIIHMIRKSKASHDIMDGVPLSYVESRGSWVKGSTAIQQCYISVSKKDKDEAYRKKYGMQTKESIDSRVELKRCSRCQAIIENNSKFCARCGMPMNMKVVAEIKDIDKETTGLVDKNMLSEMIKKIVLAEMNKK